MPSHHREREKPAKLYALAQDKQRVELKGRHYVVDGKRVGKGQFAEVYRALEASSGARTAVLSQSVQCPSNPRRIPPCYASILEVHG